MARPLRIEFPGAIHHVMARGNARQAIFLNDEDRDAYESGHRQLPQTGAHFGLHYSTCVKAQDLTPTLRLTPTLLRQGRAVILSTARAAVVIGMPWKLPSVSRSLSPETMRSALAAIAAAST